jgi:hypothetical protein
MADDPGTMRFLRTRWRESPGPDQDWGHSTWYMAFRSDGTVVEQFEVYDDGPLLHYDSSHVDDEFGGLSEPLDDAAIESALRDFSGTFLAEDEYRRTVSALRATNR